MEIRIVIDGEPPAGRLQVDDPAAGLGARRDFSGWLGLLKALEEALRSEADAARSSPSLAQSPQDRQGI
jgi:hypothetical protein